MSRQNPNLVNVYNKVNLDIEMGAIKEPLVGVGSGVAVPAPTGYYITKIFNPSTAALVISAVAGLQGGALAAGPANILQNQTWLIPCVSFVPASGSYCAYLAPLGQD